MCGIIGYIGPKEVVPVLIDGLRCLEYRGYDSAGVAVVRDGCVDLRRSAGKLSNLETVIGSAPLTGDYGVGHTRWATHGRPTEENAHPHRDRHRDRRAPRRTRGEGRWTRERGAPRADADARALRARADFGRRSRKD